MVDEVRLIHTADTHLGYRQYHSEVRRKDFMDAFAAVIDDAVKMEVDAVIHAGDLFDSRNPTLDDILETMTLFSRLKEAGIPLLAIVGNHEGKQNTQWLDLYAGMDLVTRLSAIPYVLNGVAIYGIDSVSKSKIPIFDYSIFNDKGTDANCNILVMHQLMKPFPFGEWDVKEVIDSLPFDVHALLLGDNHKHEIAKVDDTWATYCGSTERNSSSEREPRSYNVITINGSDLDISRRNILTRDFLFIPVHLDKESDAYNDIFSAIKEYDVENKVVFVNLLGDSGVNIKISEVEEFLLSRKALVPVIKDIRAGMDSLLDPSMKISFADPSDVVKEEMKKMHFTEGGIMLDEVIRDSNIPKTRVDEEVENRISIMLDNIDFTQELENISSYYSPENKPDNSFSNDSVIMEQKEDDISSSDAGVDPNIETNSDTESLNREGDSGSDKTGDDALDDDNSSDVDNESAVKPKQYNLGDYI
jgi:exonuclease SbcD